jgi:hypothetical protein
VKFALEKEPVAVDMTCKANNSSPLTMPLDAYKEIAALPLQNPQPPLATGLHGDLHYMSLEEAMKVPFTTEHLPSLEIKRARSSDTRYYRA